MDWQTNIPAKVYVPVALALMFAGAMFLSATREAAPTVPTVSCDAECVTAKAAAETAHQARRAKYSAECDAAMMRTIDAKHLHEHYGNRSGVTQDDLDYLTGLQHDACNRMYDEMWGR
jgi:hypothetical protein